MRLLQRFYAIAMILVMLFTMIPAIAENETETAIVFSGTSVSITGSNAAFADSTVTISAAGTYRLSGTGDGIPVVIQTAKEDEVTLILEQLSLSCSGTVITATGCDKLVIKLAADTVSIITAGSSSAGESTPAILCKCDTQLKGSGTLRIVSSGGPALRVTKDLKIKNGTLEITSSDTGIRVKKDMDITGGTISITSEGNGIHCGTEENETEEGTEEAGGTFTLTEGTVTINAKGDGIQSEMDLVITGGTLSVTANGGSANAAAHASESFGRGGWGSTQSTTETASAKGLKAAHQILISGGDITVDTADDAVHSNDLLTITGGTLLIATGDDGLHADKDLTIDDGTVTITTSYEGIEANHIIINGGTISVTASDDGMNANGGSDSFGMGGGWGGGWGGGRGGHGGWDNGQSNGGSTSQTDDTSDPYLYINGGIIYVNAQGDGLDSNKDLIVNGGFVIVDGPSDSMNGALDSGSENGGQLLITSGTVLAIGAAGMAEVFEASSEQRSISANISFRAGDTIVITAADGTALVEHTAAKSGSSIVFSHAALTVGETVQITCGSTQRTVTVSNNSRNSNGGGWGW